MAEYTKYQKKQLYFSTDNGVTWKPYNPPVYRQGDVIETNSPDCGYSEPQYRWYGNDVNDYVCSNFNKYYREYYQVSNDGGKTWTNVEPLQTRTGSLIETNSYDCDYGVTWEIAEGSYVCVLASETFRWVQSGTMCDGNNSYQRMIQQVSYDDGKTWTDIEGTEKKGDLIMSPSPDCSSYEFSWNETGNLICCGEVSYKELIYQYDDNGTWKNVTPIQTKKGDTVTGEFGICILEMDDSNVFNVGEINPYQGEQQDYFKVGNKLYAIQPNEPQAIQSQTYTLYELETSDFINPTKSIRTLRYGGGTPSTCSPYKPEGSKDYYSSGGRTILGGEYNVKSDVGFTQCYCYVEPDVNNNLIKYIDISENWNERYNTDYNKPPFIYPSMTTATFNFIQKMDIEGRLFNVVQLNGQDYNLPYTITEPSYTTGDFLFVPNSTTFAFKAKHDGKTKLFVIYGNKLYSITPLDIETKLQSIYGERFDSYDNSMAVYYISNDGVAYVNCGIMLKNESVRRYDVVGIRLKAASNDCHEGEGEKPVPDPTPKFTTRQYDITKLEETINPQPISNVVIVPNFPFGNPYYSFSTVYDLYNQKMLNCITAYYDYEYYQNIIKDDGTMLWNEWKKCRKDFTHIYENYIICGNYRYELGNDSEPVLLQVSDPATFYKKYAYNTKNKIIDITTNQIVDIQLPTVENHNPGQYNGYNSILYYLTQYNIDTMYANKINFDAPQMPYWVVLVGCDNKYLYTRQINNNPKTYNRFGFVDVTQNKIFFSYHKYNDNTTYDRDIPLSMSENKTYYIVYKDPNNYYLRKYQI